MTADGRSRRVRLFLKGRAIICARLVPLIPFLLVTSCSGPTMRGEFRSYNAAYADALNEQMLLDLARLENGHPAYYLAIGAINNRFTDTASATAGSTGTPAQTTDTSIRNTPFVVGKPAGIGGFAKRVAQTISQTAFGYSAGGTYSHTKNPDFQFIPINNETVAKQILNPVLPDVFFTLYQQGYPIDQLMRIMIERVEAGPVTLVNSPTAGTPLSYAKFLRACAILREMQRQGYLILEEHTRYESLGAISFDVRENRPNPTSKEFADAGDKGYVLRKEDDHWEIERKRSLPIFVLKKNTPESLIKANVTDAIKPLTSDTIGAIDRIADLLNEGIAVQTTVEGFKHAKTQLILRSFDRSMSAVATEQPAFDEFLQHQPAEISIVPPVERQPILRMMWPNKSIALERPLQTIDYNGKTYEITDPVMSPSENSARWNRDVFRLLVALNSQVTVDISKFQRQLLELLPTQ